MSLCLFVLGMLGSLCLFKPMASFNIDEKLHVKLVAGQSCLVLRYPVVACMVLYMTYSFSQFLNGILLGSLVISETREWPFVKQQLCYVSGHPEPGEI